MKGRGNGKDGKKTDKNLHDYIRRCLDHHAKRNFWHTIFGNFPFFYGNIVFPFFGHFPILGASGGALYKHNTQNRILFGGEWGLLNPFGLWRKIYYVVETTFK